MRVHLRTPNYPICQSGFAVFRRILERIQVVFGFALQCTGFIQYDFLENVIVKAVVSSSYAVVSKKFLI